jgi:hypothetical protein|tara:strand:+ start:688 stop:1173 length:486 start_codon:yes stop_codon:yes gene_type:complete
VQSKAKSVEEYMAALPEDRLEAITAIREVILKNLHKGYEEGMQWGMPSYFVPLSAYPAGYNCQPDQALPFVGFASQKNHMAIYGFCIYMDEELKNRFVADWKKSGKKLDMGKSCVRFKKLEDVPLKVIGDAVKRVPMKKYIKQYEAQLQQTAAGKKTAKKK